MKKILVLFLAVSFCMGSGVYRWVDENGTVHFGGTPPRERPAAVEQLRTSDGLKPPALDTVIAGEWYSHWDDQLLQLTVRPAKGDTQTYQAMFENAEGEKAVRRGDVSMTSQYISFIQRPSDVEHRYSYSVESPTHIMLHDREREQYYSLQKLSDSIADLDTQGRQIQGIWSEYDLRGMRSEYLIEFRGNRFTRYRASRPGVYQPPNPNLKNTFGAWSMDDALFLTFDYFGIYSPFRFSVKPSETWLIASLSSHRIELREQNSNRQLVLTRSVGRR